MGSFEKGVKGMGNKHMWVKCMLPYHSKVR